MLTEEITYNSIRDRVVQAQHEDVVVRLVVWNKALDEMTEFRVDLLTKAEQIPSGHGKGTHFRNDDPYYRLSHKASRFMVEHRIMRDKLEALLKQSQN